MGSSETRQPVVAGTFYPADAAQLRQAVLSYVSGEGTKVKAFGCIMPHAGYQYSGRVAGRTISEIIVPERVILFGPNHTGAGAPLSIMHKGSWSMPFGNVRIDEQLAGMLIDASSYLEPDIAAHENEHSLEVLLPFLQYINPNVRIVPIAVMVGELEVLRQSARQIAGVLKEQGSTADILLVASSDMTHYESEHEARRKDTAAIHAMRSLDEAKLFELINRLDLSMCGFAPVALMMACAKELGAHSARLITYQTSGDVTGDRSSVVGYAGMVVE